MFAKFNLSRNLSKAIAVGESTAAGGTLMDHRRLPHQPAARNKLICGWTFVPVPGHAVGEPRISRASSDPLRFASVSLSRHRISTNVRLAPQAVGPAKSAFDRPFIIPARECRTR